MKNVTHGALLPSSGVVVLADGEFLNVLFSLKVYGDGVSLVNTTVMFFI